MHPVHPATPFTLSPDLVIFGCRFFSLAALSVSFLTFLRSLRLASALVRPMGLTAGESERGSAGCEGRHSTIKVRQSTKQTAEGMDRSDEPTEIKAEISRERRRNQSQSVFASYCIPFTYRIAYPVRTPIVPWRSFTANGRMQAWSNEAQGTTASHNHTHAHAGDSLLYTHPTGH